MEKCPLTGISTITIIEEKKSMGKMIFSDRFFPRSPGLTINNVVYSRVHGKFEYKYNLSLRLENTLFFLLRLRKNAHFFILDNN